MLPTPIRPGVVIEPPRPRVTERPLPKPKPAEPVAKAVAKPAPKAAPKPVVKKEPVCHLCAGKGELKVEVQPMRGPSFRRHPTCWRCKGTGLPSVRRRKAA